VKVLLVLFGSSTEVTVALSEIINPVPDFTPIRVVPVMSDPNVVVAVVATARSAGR